MLVNVAIFFGFYVTFVACEPIHSDEHRSLMALFDAAQLDTDKYPRFGLDEECNGTWTMCEGGELFGL